MEASSNQPDLISALSDSILIHILSFLPSNLSGQTSILSRRWRHLWEYVPELIFHDFTDERIFSFLTHRKSSNLRRFHVTSSSRDLLDHADKYTIDQALHFCSTQGVEELNLLFDTNSSRSYNMYLLRAKTLSCWGATLRVLNLHCCLVRCPIKINLPKVEELYLSRVSMERGAFNHIITGCPSVEIFEVARCSVSLLRFHLPILKRLVLDRCFLEHINISVPNLKFFKHKGRVESLKTFLMRVDNLKEAKYCMYDNWDRNSEGYVRGYQHIFQAVAQAEHLQVNCGGIRLDRLLRIFNKNLACGNVKCLVLKNADLKFLAVVPAIIRLLPGLENLDLSLQTIPPDTPEYERFYYLKSNMSELEKKLSMHLNNTKRSIYCLSYSLRRIDVRHFEARNTQIELLKLLVQNASVLEVICFTDSYGSIARLLKSREILTSHSASKNIKFLDQKNLNRHVALEIEDDYDSDYE
ncbi:F-box/RNI-like superfamily protein [Rhynchospora pubera]|uniref:F-box/RNI-like superfamily protein n=1 Tax=Rhynchospora pubera TaxID=906938 RepID=A0AAV8HNE6_9POAL|nr:F-box/RNI-like superfamily protein [Rhynchospora pubera]KAJ4816303.1 F-box/RNI-like superfamily protein [Rhynchospora pubera]